MSAIVELFGGGVAVDSAVTVRGWVRTRRDSKAGFSFLAVHDGSCFDAIQVVAPAGLANYQSEIAHVTTGCAVIVNGTLVASQGKGQRVEIQADSVEVAGWVDDPDSYPVSAKQHSFEYLREVAHLRMRTNTFGAVTRVRHALAMAAHGFFDGEGFCWIPTPIITASDCEGAGAMFRVSTLDMANLPRTAGGAVDDGRDFFGKPAYLTVSGQLNAEAYCLAMGKVYTFGPTFRAENSNTPRHLAEFWMIEPEVAFADLAADADLAERFLKHLFRELLERRGDDMRFFADRIDKTCIDRLERFIGASFERMEYGEAVAALEKSGERFEFPVSWGMDLQTEHERYLTEKLVGRPVVVMNYPKEIKAFYMRQNDDGRTVAAMDVLAPGIGEIIGGSQREERLDRLDERLGEMGLDKESYGWYRDLRRYGTAPHAGFGLGFERTILYATGMQNIRDAIPFPRTPNNAAFCAGRAGRSVAWRGVCGDGRGIFAGEAMTQYGYGAARRGGLPVRWIVAALIAVGGLVSYYSSTETNPVTGEKQHVAMSVDQEKALGLQSAPEMAAQMGGAVDPAGDGDARRVGEVGRRVVERSDASKSPYVGNFHFYLLDDPRTINAFALPGGQVFITRGLYDKLRTEAQLAGVLGHEVGHVIGRHAAEHMATGRLGQMLSVAVGVGASDDRGGGYRAQAVAAMVNQMMQLKYSRADESEADTLGLGFMAQAGYDPSAMLGVMEILKAASGGSRQPEFMATHPHPEHRIETIKGYLAKHYPNGVPGELTEGAGL